MESEPRSQNENLGKMGTSEVEIALYLAYRANIQIEFRSGYFCKSLKTKDLRSIEKEKNRNIHRVQGYAHAYRRAFFWIFGYLIRTTRIAHRKNRGLRAPAMYPDLYPLALSSGYNATNQRKSSRRPLACVLPSSGYGDTRATLKGRLRAF